MNKKKYLNFSYLERVNFLKNYNDNNFNDNILFVRHVLYIKIQKNRILSNIIFDDLYMPDISDFLIYGRYYFIKRDNYIMSQDAYILIKNDIFQLLNKKDNILTFKNIITNNIVYALSYQNEYISFAEKLYLGKANKKRDLFESEINEMYNIFITLNPKLCRLKKLKSIL